MKRNTPYKDPDLSLDTLASCLGISRRMITDAVNTCLGQNIQTFINSHRIEAVKKNMSDPKNSDKTLLEIGFEQGFNSKSAFNRSFKTQTGMTPSEFRKQNT
jgi:AraC-like DNA-binding protein